MSQPSTTEPERLQNSPSTLGDVLYARLKPKVLEQDWAALVQSIASGDELALHTLYKMAHRYVFTLAMRITANRETAEEVTLDVFHDVWRRGSGYDAANGTVLGWIMNQARSRAIDRLRFESRKKRSKLRPFLLCLNGRGEAVLTSRVDRDDYSRQTMNLLCHAVIKKLPAFMA